MLVFVIHQQQLIYFKRFSICKKLDFQYDDLFHLYLPIKLTIHFPSRHIFFNKLASYKVCFLIFLKDLIFLLISHQQEDLGHSFFILINFLLLYFLLFLFCLYSFPLLISFTPSYTSSIFIYLSTFTLKHFLNTIHCFLLYIYLAFYQFFLTLNLFFIKVINYAILFIR